jgi:hypothetical protein
MSGRVDRRRLLTEVVRVVTELSAEVGCVRLDEILAGWKETCVGYHCAFSVGVAFYLFVYHTMAFSGASLRSTWWWMCRKLPPDLSSALIG